MNATMCRLVAAILVLGVVSCRAMEADMSDPRSPQHDLETVSVSEGFVVSDEVSHTLRGSSSAGATTGSSTSTSGTKAAIAFEGGGFMAAGGYWGLTAILLGAEVPNPTKTMGELFGRFDIMSACSGAVWFQLQTVFSEYVTDLLHRMATSKDKAGDEFTLRWMSRFLFGKPNGTTTWLQGINSKNKSKCQMMRHLEDEIHTFKELIPQSILDGVAKGWVDITDLLYYLRSHHLTGGKAKELRTFLQKLEMLVFMSTTVDGEYMSYYKWIETMFQETAGISPNTLMSSAPLEWAKGKEIIQISTIATNPSGNYIRVDPSPISYTQNGNHSLTPGIFGYKLGSGDQRSTRPYCGDPKCHSIKLAYKGTAEASVEASDSLGAFFDDNVDSVLGSFPISRVGTVASSLGYYLLPRHTRATSLEADSCGLDAVMWAAKGKGGNTWDRGDALWRSTLGDGHTGDADLEAVASKGLVAVYDGGIDLDGTAVVSAVASGATSVVSWTDWWFADGNYWDTEFWRLFRNEADPDPVRDYLCSSPTRKEVQAIFDDPANVLAPTKKTLFFRNITFGTLPTCITADVPKFGIEAGRKVAFSFAAITTMELDSGLTTPLSKYGDSIQEMTDALTDPVNADKLAKLHKMVVSGSA